MHAQVPVSEYMPQGDGFADAYFVLDPAFRGTQLSSLAVVAPTAVASTSAAGATPKGKRKAAAVSFKDPIEIPYGF